jgi:pimeloyl-ACP methyl ester carboxylesterase
MTEPTPTPVLFMHGLWLHATSWQAWLEKFRAAGYNPVAPGWPNEPDTIEQARLHPEAVANIGIDEIAAHYTKIAEGLPASPILVGHSFGGLMVQKLLGDGVGRAGVAIDPAQIKGVLPLPPAQLRSAGAVLGNPFNLKKAVSLTEKQFRYGFGNAVSIQESKQLFEQWTIPSPARPLFQASVANFAPHSEAKVDTANVTRGPLLFVSGLEDHTVPDVVTRAAFKLYHKSSAVTELEQFEHRGHSLTIDSGNGEVIEAVLTWLKAKDL